MNLVSTTIFQLALLASTIVPNSQSKQPATIKLDVARSSVQIADPFVVSLTVSAPTGSVVTFPPIEETIGQFDLIGHKDDFDLPSASDPAIRSWTRQMTLETIETGLFSIPTFEVIVKTTDSESPKGRVLQSDPFSVEVISVLEESEQSNFHDIKPTSDVEITVNERFDWSKWLVASGLGIIVVTVIGLCFRRNSLSISPARWAENELTQLKHSSELKNENSTVVLAQLDSIFRTFCQSQLGIPAQSASPEQLVSSLNKRIPESICQAAGGFLQQSEQVRFAGVRLTTKEINETISALESLVREITAKTDNELPNAQNSSEAIV